MPDYPLMVFPTRVMSSRMPRNLRGGASVRLPDADQQAGRLMPQFQRLQEAFDSRRVALQGSPDGVQLEQVLVLETIGPVDNFIRAVQKVAGLEWLGEVDDGEAPPEFGFEDLAHPDRDLNGWLLLVMSDQRALEELRRLFELWRNDPSVSFSRGLAPLKSAFEHLRTIRPWGPEDRVRDTGVVENWDARLMAGEVSVPFEVDLWFRQDSARRTQQATSVRNEIEALGGEWLGECVIPEIRYHGALGRVPAGSIDGISESRDILSGNRLLLVESIMRIRPVGQCAVLVPGGDDLVESVVTEALPAGAKPFGRPLVALLDGLPLAQHELLSDRLFLEDPDDYARNYLASQRIHGTMMASLICHGDLDSGGGPAGRLVYVRPILKPKLRFGRYYAENIPEDVLPLDLIHRAVRRLFEGDGDEAPVAPEVRVINLSVCDRMRPFYREVSPMARLLDWLAYRYNVLFIVSAGNHLGSITLDVRRDQSLGFTPEEREKAVIKALADDNWNRRLLAPAETLNGLTVGSLHADGSSGVKYPFIDPFVTEGIPSVFSAQGPGQRRGVKPDLFLAGGRQALQESVVDDGVHTELELFGSRQAPGQKAAYPGQSGSLNELCYSRGTSNAAALASRGAMMLYDVIEELREEFPEVVTAEFDAVLLKALLVHGANWSKLGRLYRSILTNGGNARQWREDASHMLGYGNADIPKVTTCTGQRATIVGNGVLDDNAAAEFHLPLPPSLQSLAQWRRLTVTLAWLTPVVFRSPKYRNAQLWFELGVPNGIVGTPENVGHIASQRGTVQHEVFEGSRAVPFQNGDSVSIKVNCRADAGKLSVPVRFALLATLEVEEGIGIPIYQEIRDRLGQRVSVVAGTV